MADRLRHGTAAAATATGSGVVAGYRVTTARAANDNRATFLRRLHRLLTPLVLVALIALVLWAALG